jgi:hypothetical protein
MSEVHLLSDLLIVALYESITYGEYAVFLAKNEGGTLNILCTNVSLDLLKVFPRAVAKSLNDTLWMTFLHSLCNVFARVATIIVRRASEFVLNT